MRNAPKPGQQGGQHKPIGEAWNVGHQSVLIDMKKAILSDPILQRPDPLRRFYLKTDYSSMGYGAALCQAGNGKEEREAEQREELGGRCDFERKVSGLRLHPVLFESKATSGPDRSDHSHPGEAKAGDFAIQKFRTFLWGKPFTWIADCSSLKAFFEQRDMPNHQMERLRMRMLCFQFTIEHRNASMVREVDLLSRYNKLAKEFGEGTKDTQATTHMVATTWAQNQYSPISSSNVPIMFAGPRLAPRTEAAKRWAKEMVIVLGTAGIGEVEEAIRSIGQEPIVAMAVETNTALRSITEKRLGQAVHESTDELLRNLHQAEGGELDIDMYVATCHLHEKEQMLEWLRDHLNAVSSIAECTELRSAMICFTNPTIEPPKVFKQFDTMLRYDGWKVTIWKLKTCDMVGQ